MKNQKKVSYPRVYVSPATHKRVLRVAKKLNQPMNKIGNEIVVAGLKALHY